MDPPALPAWTLILVEFLSSDIVACLLHEITQICIVYVYTKQMRIVLQACPGVSASDKAVNLQDKPMSRGLRVREGCNGHRKVNSLGLLSGLTLTQ